MVRGSIFDEGSLQIMYYGQDRELGGHLEITNPEHSLIFAEELMPMTAMSSRLEAVSWQRSTKSDVRLALSNTSDSPVAATIKIDGIAPRQRGPATIILSPRQTRVVDAEDFAHNGYGTLHEIIGISIAHNGAPGALLARGFVSEPSAGFSSSIEFVDPAMSLTSTLDGTGLRLALPGGAALTPVVIARNTATTPSAINGRLSYTMDDGTLSSLSLPEIRLAPGELAPIDLSQVIRANRVNRERIVTAGLGFTYSTEPGTVLISARTVSRDGNQVFHVPVVDAKSEPASAAGYPWVIDGESHTVAYLKNVTDGPRQYTMQLSHEGGVYSLGMKTLQPKETMALDIRDLRDRQVADAQGHTIPLNASRGQVSWSMRGPENHILIGRSEQVDIAQGISSTYACMNCCPDSFSMGWVDPGMWEALSGESTFMSSLEQDVNCYGMPGAPFNPWPGWNSTIWTVVSCDQLGHTTAESPGEAHIQAIWTAYEWGDFETGGAGECNARERNVIAEALCEVLARSLSE